MKIPQFIKAFSRHVLLVSLPMLIPLSVVADETEIFFQNDSTRANSNVLFLLDGSGSMRATLSGSDGKSRMQVMKDAFRQVMIEAPDNINVGLMHYANSPNGTGYGWSSIKGVTFPVSPIDQKASEVMDGFESLDNISASTSFGGEKLRVRDFLANIVDTWGPSGYTPIVDSLYEAARYFKGEEVVWGKFPPAYHWAAHPSTYTGDELACVNGQMETCTKEWGECNGTEHSCADVVLGNICRNWIVNPDGSQFCENNDYSGTQTVTKCQHQVCSSISGEPEYKSPIEYACQSNYLVLMSDGKPEYSYYPGYTADGTGRYAKSAYPGYPHNYSNPSAADFMPELLPEVSTLNVFSTNPTIPDLTGTECVDKPNGYASGTCGPELTAYLAGTDMDSTLEGNQTVETYTVAFGMGDEPTGTDYLASLATAENGAYTADDADELVEAFKSVFGQIEKNSFSFSSPSFSVSEDSLLSHGSSVYVPVMDVGRSAIWSGNLRKFTLSDSGHIVSADGSTAALTNTGEFATSARDLWSASAHGSDVKEGGAANKLPAPGARVLYTDPVNKGLKRLSTVLSAAELPNALFGGGETYQTEHGLQDWLGGTDGHSLYGWYMDCDGKRRIVRPWAASEVVQGPVDIEEITTCVSDAVTDDERNTLVNFAQGYVDGVSGDGAVARNHMGDMLNTKPQVVTYKDSSGAVAKTLVFAATNEGYLHAIDADTGVEQWAFMPASLLKNQKTFLSNAPGQKHIYGLDGPMTLWQFTEGEGDDAEAKKYLFFSMRRGGNMIYALDISEGTPKVAWKISPTGERGAIGTGFSGLGETWSKPTLSRMRNPSDPSEMLYVLVFGGGYDPRMDELDPADRASGAYAGSDVYIVNALTGARIWSLKGSTVTGVPGSGITASDLTHSVPGDIRVLDMDNDGALDRLYFADTGGYIWRVDMKTTVSGTGTDATLALNAQLTRFADLGAGTAGGVSADGDRRKFFYEPDTALRLTNGVPKLTISIGSGYRTHPLDTGDEDRFYVLLDENVYQTPGTGFTTITEADLMTVTELRASDEGNILDVADKRGWYYPFPRRGEKVLATSLTFLDKILFTTFALADASGADSVVGVCEPAVNTSRAYVLDLLTGQPVANLDRETEVEGVGDSATITSTNDDFLIAGYNEILDSPQLVFSELTNSSGGACTVGDCQQSVSIRIGKLNVPVVDLGNSSGNSGNDFSSSVDLTEILPRLYWRDEDVSGSETLEGVDSSTPE